jgi:hypothetical protein
MSPPKTPARGLPLAGEVVLVEPVPNTTTRSLARSEKVNWLWSYFEIQEFQNEWVEKRSKKIRHTDRKFRCTVVVEATGKQCEWFTTDSKRQTSTTNLRSHLKEKRGILPPSVLETAAAPRKALLIAFEVRSRNSPFNNVLKRTLCTGVRIWP